MTVLLMLSGSLQLHLLNQAMKYYDQLEAVPIYQTCLMVMWIITGLIVLDEKQHYSWLELGTMAGSIFLCCIGIVLLTKKTKAVRQAAKEELKSSRSGTSVNN